jgi:hypothetical protein
MARSRREVGSSEGKVALKDGGEFIELTGNQLVNNEFAAPEATGCGGIFAFLLAQGASANTRSM